MRRIVAEAFLSLDGVTEDPGRFGEYEHRGWTIPLNRYACQMIGKRGWSGLSPSWSPLSRIHGW